MTATGSSPVPAPKPRPPSRRRGAARAGAADLALACRHPRTAGGRASSRPTSRWTPRTSCCASSSASAPTEQTAPPATWIRSHQREDGTWANFYGGPGRPLDHHRGLRRPAPGRRPGRRPPHAARPPAFIREPAGSRRRRVFTRIWLALFGLWPWDELPVMPPELIFLPPWVPLNIYDFGCWARQTVVAADRRLRPPARCARSRSGSTSCADRRPRRAGPPSLPHLGGAFTLLDRSCTATSGRAGQASCAGPRCAGPSAGSSRARRPTVRWGGIQPPWVYSLMALHLQGYPLDHPVMRAGPGRPRRRSPIEDDAGRRIEACQSPVWDTALAVIALPTPALGPTTRRCCAAAAGCSARRSRVRGDWAVRRPDLAAGGWAFEFANDNYPDIDDTAEVVLALRRTAAARRPAAVAARPSPGSLGMQCRGRRVGRVRRRQHQDAVPRAAVLRLRRADRPAERRRHRPRRRDAGRASARPRPARRRGASVAAATTRRPTAPGSGAGAPTTSTAPARSCRRSSPPASARPTRRSAGRWRWLDEHQNADGGWGEDLRSYDDPAWRGRGASTASQTAWALLALLAAGERERRASGRGVPGWSTPSAEDGTWDEPWFTGTGFPGRLLHQLPPLPAWSSR